MLSSVTCAIFLFPFSKVIQALYAANRKDIVEPRFGRWSVSLYFHIVLHFVVIYCMLFIYFYCICFLPTSSSVSFFRYACYLTAVTLQFLILSYLSVCQQLSIPVYCPCLKHWPYPGRSHCNWPSTFFLYGRVLAKNRISPWGLNYHIIIIIIRMRG